MVVDAEGAGGRTRSLVDALMARAGKGRFRPAESWTQALAASPGGYPTTRRPSVPWQAPDRRFANDTEVHIMACLSKLGVRHTLRVLDLGGAFGQLAHTVAWVWPQTEIEWTVWELPEVVASAADLAGTHGNLTLHFTDHAPAQPVDLAVASAVLQYLPEGLARLPGLAGLAKWIVIDRLPLWPLDEDRVAVQHESVLGGALYPVWFLAESQAESAIRSVGRIELRWLHRQDTAFFAGVRCNYKGVLLSVR
ncbi:MAG: methyltransferase, TIGR04325 family [Actinobacteria bacterium]|nr:MAG: methyltransferase, TIGR04325 family [Actinomycetota bacterium]